MIFEEGMIFEKQVREEMWFPPPRSDSGRGE